MNLIKSFSVGLFLSLTLFSGGYAQTGATNLNTVQKFSLRFYCFAAPLLKSDTSRCAEKLQTLSQASSSAGATSSAKPVQKVFVSSPTSTTESFLNTLSQTPTPSAPPKETVSSQPIYITRYISTPGPKGDKGDKGDAGTAAATLASTNPLSNTFSSNTYAGAQYGGYFAPAVNTSSQLVGVSTVGYLNGATSENTLLKATTTVEGILNVSAATTFYSSPLFTQGFTSSATSTFNGPSFFNGHATFASLPSMPLSFGNVLVGSSEGKAEPLAPGTQNQVFTINASGTPVWMSSANLTGLAVTGNTILRGTTNINTTGTATTTVGNASSTTVVGGRLSVLDSSFFSGLASFFDGAFGGSLSVSGTSTLATTSVSSLSSLSSTLSGTTSVESLVLASTTLGTSSDDILVRDSSGVVKKITPTSLLSGATSLSLTSTSNTLTTTVNGNSATTSLINSVDITASTTDSNIFSVAINGVASAWQSFVNSFSQTLSGNTLTTTINGVVATSSVISSNSLEVSGTTLISTVNGVSTSTDLSYLVGSSTSNTATTTSNILTTTINGVEATTTVVTSNVLTSLTNTLTSTVNGIASAAANIINSLSTGVTGNTLTLEVNGVTATTSVISQNTLSVATTTNDVTLSSDINGIISTTTFSTINSNVATSSANLLSTVVNGVTSSFANIINSFTQTLSGNILTTTINGVTATSSVVSSNVLSFSTTTNSIISDVNGVSSSVSIPLSASTSNGLLSAFDWSTFSSKLTSSLSAGKVFVGNSSGVASEVNISGDATLSSSGALTLVNTGVVAGSYGSVSGGVITLPVLSVDSKGRLTAVGTTTADINALADSRITLQRGAANGIASLDSAGKIPSSQIPAISFSNTFVKTSLSGASGCTSETTALRGDICIDTAASKTYVLSSSNYASSTSWTELLTPGAPVQTVNTLTGSIDLTASNGLTRVGNSDYRLGGTLSTTTAVSLNSNNFSFTGSGNIGIGTASPNTKLELSSGTSGSSGLRFTNLTNSTAGTSTFSGLLGVNSTGDVGVASISGSSLSGFTAGQLAFGSSTGGLTQSSNLFWDNASNVLSVGGTAQAGAITAIGGKAFSALPYGVASVGTITHSPSGWNGSGFAFSNTTTGSNIFSMVYNADEAWFGQLSSSANTVIGKWNTSRFYLSNNLGVGVLTPTARVQVAAGTATSGTAPLKFTSGTNLTTPEAGAVEYDGTQIYVTPTSTRNIIAQISGSSPFTVGSIPFASSNGYLTASSSQLFWDNTNGRLGIGTNSPTDPLHIYSAGAGRMLFESSNASAGQASIDLKIGATQYWRLIGQGSLNGSRFDIHNQITNSPSLSITQAGNIGIGTTAPGARLEIKSSTASTSGLRFTNLTNSALATSSFSGILGVNSTGDVGVASISGSSLSGFTAGQLAFGSSTGGLTQSSNLFWDSLNGRLGVGTNVPQNTFHVAGSVRLDVGSDATGDILYRSSSGSLARLALGSSGKFLKSDGSTPVWGDALGYYLANGTNSATTASRDLNSWVTTQGTSVISTDNAAAPTNVPNGLGAWFGAGFQAVGAGYYSQLYLTDQGSFFRGGSSSSINSNQWRTIPNFVSFNKFQFNTASTTADSDLTLMKTGAYALAFGTNNTERMRIDSVGNIGIGTTAPNTKLELSSGVAGTSGLRFTNLLSSNSAATGTDKFLTVNANGDVVLATSTTANTAWYLASSTTDAGGNKTSAIERVGNTTVTNGYFRAISSVTTNVFTMDPSDSVGPKLKLGTTSLPGGYFEIGAYNSVNNFDTKTRDLVFWGSSGNAQGIKMAASTGYVSIGLATTTTPLGRLIVNDTSYISTIPATTANLMDNTTFRPHTRLQTTSGINNNAFSTYMTTAAIAQQAHNYSTGASLPYLIQPVGGNVGIGGTAAPATRFQVSAGASTTDGLYVRGGADWDALGLAHDGSTAFINASGAESGLALRVASGAAGSALTQTYTEGMRILSNGNIGIGLTSPTAKLHIASTTASTSVASLFKITSGAAAIEDLDVVHVADNFGGLVSSGAFVAANSMFAEEFNNPRNTTALIADSAGTIGDDQSLTFDTTSTTATFSTPLSVVNGVGRLSFGATTGVGSVIGLGRTVGSYNAIYLKANLPVLQVKMKPSSTAVTEDYRVGFMANNVAALGVNDSSPTNGIYFSNENGTSWTGVVRNGGVNVGTVSCSAAGSISTTQFAVGRIVVESATSVRFLMDNDASNGVKFTDCGVVSGVNPTAALTLGVMYTHTSTTATTFDIDYLRTWQDDNIENSSSEELSVDSFSDLVQEFESNGSLVSLDTFLKDVLKETRVSPFEKVISHVKQSKEYVLDLVAVRVSAIAGYFENIFAKKATLDEVCVKKSNGSYVCLTGDDLEKLKTTVSSSNSGSAAGDSSNSSSSTPTSTSTPASDSSATTTPAETPSSPEETTPAETSTPVESPAAEVSPSGDGSTPTGE